VRKGARDDDLRIPPRTRSGPALEAFIREHEYRGELDTGLRRATTTPRRSDRPGLLLWLNTAAKLRARLLTSERGMAGEEMTVRPEDTLGAAGISTKRQAKYQRRMSSLLAGR